MRIEFKLGEYKDIYERFYELLSRELPLETDEIDGEYFVVSPYRVVIPQIGLALREGDWFVNADGCLEMEEGEDWHHQGHIMLVYGQDGEDPGDMLDYSTAGIHYTLQNALKGENCLSVAELDGLDCYIETDEFIDENTAYMLMPTDDEDQYGEGRDADAGWDAGGAYYSGEDPAEGPQTYWDPFGNNI